MRIEVVSFLPGGGGCYADCPGLGLPQPVKVLDRPIAHHQSNEVLVGFFLYREHHACPKRLYQPKFPFDE
jgi:hypothetical protein